MTTDQPDRLPDFLPGPEAMLFSSFEYLLVFLPATVMIYFLFSQRFGNRAGKTWLVLASLFFYGWWSPDSLWLIGGSILFNFGMARWIGRLDGLRARVVLAAAIAGNLGLLGYYKYASFFITNLNVLAGSHIDWIQLVLPLGISFFTFTQIAFLVDVHRGIAREYNLLHYCLFVTYFPHLIAGPILHHSEMMPQFASPTAHHVDWRNIHTGILLIAIGLAKKVILADSLAAIADQGFNTAHKETLLFHQGWMASIAYTLQLYLDFSGYTDIAIGSALLCNIRLPENFNSPYKATNIQDFWRRWHITLSRWLRDYLYIALGGNRHGLSRSYAALLITFVLGGLWHGANWTFVLWGLLHGIAALLHKTWQMTGLRMPSLTGWLLTFLFVNTAWVFFRADSLTDAFAILQAMSGLHGFASADELIAIVSNILEPDTWNPLLEPSPGRHFLLLLGSLLLVWLMPNARALTNMPLLSSNGMGAAAATGAIAGISLFYTLFLSSGITAFIYFYF